MKYLGTFNTLKQKLKVGEHYLIYGRYIMYSGSNNQPYDNSRESYLGVAMHKEDDMFIEQFAYTQSETDFDVCFRKNNPDIDSEYLYSNTDDIWLLTDQEVAIILMTEMDNKETYEDR